MRTGVIKLDPMKIGTPDFYSPGNTRTWDWVPVLPRKWNPGDPMHVTSTLHDTGTRVKL